MNKLITLYLFLISFLYLNAQTVIQMVEYKGVYTVLCEVNGMKGRMIFDTGASKISLSNSFCEILLDNGYISESDFVGQGKCITADGRIIDHAEIILHSVKIGDIELNDVPAVVVNNQNAPMLFGQSAIQMLGEVSMKGDKLYIKKENGTDLGTKSNTFEKWDAKHYRYSNYTYGFGWDLPKDIEWRKVEGMEKHTVFRAETKTIAVFVNAQVANKIKDLWDVYDIYTATIEQLDKQNEKKTGLLVYERTFTKKNLIGQHAIKTTFKEYFKDDRYEEPFENHAEEYIVIHNGFTFIIAVKIRKDLYDAIDCSQFISDIFKGFYFTVKN